jgi:ABC-2 type transport system ATP-binding protein
MHTSTVDESGAAKTVSVSSFQMRFGEKEVIHNLSFSVSKGEIFGFLGANGAGKTTTIRALLGLLTPTAGSLLVNGASYTPAMTAMLGYLPEQRGLYRNEPILDTLTYFGVLHGLSWPEAKARSLKYLDDVDLADKAKTRFATLSGGEQQKVQLGATIIHDPSLLVLDEPTEALDPVNRALLLRLINEHRDRGATVVLVTHRLDEVEQVCDRALILKDGAMAAYGTITGIKAEYGGISLNDVFLKLYNGEKE